MSVKCECGQEFESPREAVTHAKESLHKVRGLYYSHRLEIEEHFHQCGICTHVVEVCDDGARTVCIANNPVATRRQA